MTRTAFSKICLLVCGLGLLLAPNLAASVNSAAPVTLKVQVHMPPSWNLLPGEPLPDFLAASLSDALTRHGLSWPVTALRSVEDSTKVAYLLKIDVTDWGRNGDGDLTCTLTATLRTPQGERRIGVYRETAWAPGVIYAHAKTAYFPTRQEPIRALVRDLEKSDLLSNPPA
jgi:hypothetical protein